MTTKKNDKKQKDFPYILHIDIERGWRGGQQQLAYLLTNLPRQTRNKVLCRENEPMWNFAKSIGIDAIAFSSMSDILWNVLPTLRKDRIQIIHAHSSHSHNVALLIKAFYKNPKLVVSRRVDFHRKAGIINRWKYTSPKTDCWAAVSNAVGNILREDGVPEERIRVIYDGVDCKKYEYSTVLKERKSGRNQYAYGKDDILIGNVAALADHKDQETLIRAISIARSENPHIKLFIAGEGQCRAKLESLVKKLGLEDHVQMPGFLKDLRMIFGMMDIYAMSSKTEGLGTSVIDAMSARLPIVVTNAGGLGEIIRNEVNGITVPVQNPVTFAKAILRLTEDKALCLKLSKQAQKDAQKFNALTMANKTYSLYLELMQD